MSSFLKKALKGKYEDPFSQIKDKAGVRVITHYPWDMARIEQLVRGSFIICEDEDKRTSGSFQTLGYRGTHFEVKLSSGPAELCGLSCEVQVLTRAESLWADTAHYLSYKPAQPPSDHVQRAIYRLIALVEIFDSEVERAYDAIRSDKGYEEARLLHVLEQYYYQFAAKQGDHELSLEVLSILSRAQRPELLETFESSVEDFVTRNRDKLVEFYERHREDDRANPFIWQPEVILILLQLESDSFILKEAWQEVFPLELLISLADAWGAAI